MIKPRKTKFKQSWKLWLIYGISSFLISSCLLPIGVLAISQNHGELLIALPIDDPAVKKIQPKINEIKLPEAPTQATIRARIKPPAIAPKKATNTDNNPRPNRDNTPDNPRPNRDNTPDNPRPNRDNTPDNPRPNRNNTPDNPKPNRDNTPSNPKPNRNNTPNNRNSRPSNDYSSKEPTFREIDFVDIPFGILAPGDFQFENRYFHFYRFEGKENQVIQLRLVGSADKRRTNNLSLLPYMFLLDPNSNILLQRGTSGESNKVNDAFVYTKLPSTGTYTIAITSQQPGDRGRYTLALRNDRASYIEDQSTEITTNSPTLPNGNAYDINQFQGKKGQLVSIRVDSVFEEFSPFVVLLNANGEVVSLDNRQEGAYSTLIDRAKLPDDGTYFIVTISRNPQERGKYRLTIF